MALPAFPPDEPACWDLQPARAWLAGQARDDARFRRSGFRPGADLAAFATRVLGYPMVLTRIGFAMGPALAEPAFWVRKR
jgi:hypothetical protein